LVKERDQYKEEYNNLCEFTNDFEEQRDFYKSHLEKLHNGLVNDSGFDSGDIMRWASNYEKELNKRNK
jgi:hypothetical protein